MTFHINGPVTQNHRLARSIAAGGKPVFPCRESGNIKAPYTSNGFRAATCDIEQIDAWWARWPNAVPGIPTGSPSGLAVLDGDLDRSTGEAAGEAEIEALGLSDPRAVKVITQSGGVQYFFRYVEGTKCTAGQVADHVDTRGEGG